MKRQEVLVNAAPSARKKSRKQVRISEAKLVVFALSAARTAEERDSSWWTATEFAATRDSVKEQCRNHRRERRYSDCLTDVYEKACCLAQKEEEGTENDVTATNTAPSNTAQLPDQVGPLSETDISSTSFVV
jgi:hypothetical protein